MLPIRAGTSGFRGATNTEITPAHALAIGQLYAQHLRSVHTTSNLSIAIGHDQRHGAELLATAVAAGVRSGGVDALWWGQIPTGLFSFVVADRHQSGGQHVGILVTGSHMPPDRIGIIPMNEDGTYCTEDVTGLIAEGMTAFPESCYRAPWDHLLGEHRFEAEGIKSAWRRYHSALMSHINWQAISQSGYRVLLDPGNGTMGPIAKSLLELLGCDVRTTFFEPKPVPDRPSECRPSSCAVAMRLVKELMCDVGFCFDGDGDRVLVIDESGNAFSEDIVGAFLAQAVLQEGDVCVATVDASALIDEVCKERGARVVRCKIGQPATGRAIKEHGATFCYEPSAKYGWPQQFLWYDGLVVAAKILELMATMKRRRISGIMASELSAGFVGRFFKGERSLPLPAEVKDRVVERVFARAREIYAGIAEVTELDGLRVAFKDGTWLLLRPSGTEPKARIYADSRSQDHTDELLSVGGGLFKEAIAQATV